MTNIQAIFIDRDGTIGGDTTIHYPIIYIISFYKSITAKLKANHIKFSLSQINRYRGWDSDYSRFFTRIKSFGFDDIYVCPHKHSDGCECRKPSTGMLLQAAEKHGLDLTQCAVIGDRWTDIVAGAKVNATTILVRTGAGYDALHTYRDKWAHIEPSYIAENFEDATNWVLNQL